MSLVRPASFPQGFIMSAVPASSNIRQRWVRRSLIAVLAAFVVAAFALAPTTCAAQGGAPGKRIAAPEFAGVDWLGTDKPIRLRDLRGKIVVLDFWTLC
jgi:hypothetical protein